MVALAVGGPFVYIHFIQGPAPAPLCLHGGGHLRVALATLPPRTQEVLRLRFQEGLSYKEIAGVMQLTVSHVGVLIHNGLKSLRARLDAPRLA